MKRAPATNRRRKPGSPSPAELRRPPAAKAFLENFANPHLIINDIENHSDGADDPYWRRIEELMAAGFSSDATGDVDLVDDAKLLRNTQGGRMLEQVARHAGFILGLEYFSQLIVTGLKGAGHASKSDRKGGAR